MLNRPRTWAGMEEGADALAPISLMDTLIVFLCFGPACPTDGAKNEVEIYDGRSDMGTKNK